MRLLYNNMLSDKLIAQLADIYPDSLHIKNIGPENAPDTDVWTYAREFLHAKAYLCWYDNHAEPGTAHPTLRTSGPHRFTPTTSSTCTT